MLEVYDFLTTSQGLAQEYTETIHFSEGEIIYQYDWSKNNHFLLMRQGVARIEIYRKRRWEFETFISIDEFGGIENLIKNRLFSTNIKYRIVAASDGEALMVDREFFLDHMYANPALFHKVLENVTLHQIMTAHNFREKKSPLKQRLADIVLEFIMFSSVPIKDNHVTLPFPFSEEIISSALKVPIHHIQSILNFLEKEKIITREHEFEVIDYVRLGKLSNLNPETCRNNTFGEVDLQEAN
ncbi:Crp/Fnr family transcriptional regulator [Listeria booriae]|uniref:Crp/Fnr family transcriptional regulator n=1 Tax=Listeria booriae TaxID=1552123 RepID=A0A7X0ZWM5_9LIST|nr:Crp/Fnr family transcriptional regulator [Listeria booriae]MBC2284808.1 Crp/Fnr family transcriptional regulator [Listeria booriae]MBC2293650.1 Crp/Fnr family transcriptional regulator [Listeria booriae]MBC2305357.1 Crp/Fnr family transcriptional regulator [Listeria booriae]MBC2311903.1 Crp/Fnr family transcriptional regulator [Listeria booriae]